MSKTYSVGVTAVQLLDAVGEQGAKPVLHLAASERRAEQIGRFLSVAAPEVETIVFPPWDSLPYDRASPSREAMGRRMAGLRSIRDRADRPLIVITTPEAVVQRLPPLAEVRGLELRTGEPFEADALRRFCLDGGYVEDDRVDEVGEIAFRGGVVDLFPAGHVSPFRLEVADGRIALHSFDPLSQRTTAKIATLTIDPVSELPAGAATGEPGAEQWLADAYPKLATLFDHLPDALLIEDPQADERLRGVLSQIDEAHRDRVKADGLSEAVRAAAAPERLYLTVAEWRKLSAPHREEPSGASERFAIGPRFSTERRPERAFAAFIKAEAEVGRRVLLIAASDGDLRTLTRHVTRALGRDAAPIAGWTQAVASAGGSVLALKAELEEGFVDGKGEVTVVTAHDLLGSRAKGPDGGTAVLAPWQAEAADFRFGDLVVHVDHGLGVVRGLDAITTPLGAGEAIRLEYANAGAVLTPVEEAGDLWRYGSEEGAVTLDRLNTDGWIKRRAKIQAEMDDTARKLIALAAEREELRAPKLLPAAQAYERFAARFPYSETPDQRAAIEQVLNDLGSGRPMDRLVVGDVGFGKTEVALRAAAAVALSGKQVAVVAPTTVLARQHFSAFTRRFSDLGVEVAHLSRLVTTEEARRVKAGLSDGSVRVVVGTHALASESVEFADLGLLVVDEEQRFGSAHKAKLRSLGESVHVLTLTATPIPRTLQTALVGLQDLSTISTAPARRRPIRTVLEPFDAATIRTALVREKRRGGQSFVVVPRIEDIEPTVATLTEAAPELDLRVAHGKMPARDVDITMVDFAEGRGDVLLATSIIESGLDVPRANTMVVLRADLFGLAQLHQLRGRVGRGRTQGVCFLMTEPDKPLADATAKRLGTLQAFDRLGAGMAISARDLDLRGAGDLMGDEQAGHLKLMGLSLYQELLARALKQARGETEEEWRTEFQGEAGGSIPPDYVPEPEVRLNLYHRLARAASPEDVEALSEEISDRFGPQPPAVAALLATTGVRALAHLLRVVKITAGPQAIALTFAPGVDPARTFEAALAGSDGSIEWTGERVVYRKPSETTEARSALVRELLEQLG